jgi:hypothetical protein
MALGEFCAAIIGTTTTVNVCIIFLFTNKTYTIDHGMEWKYEAPLEGSERALLHGWSFYSLKMGRWGVQVWDYVFALFFLVRLIYLRL